MRPLLGLLVAALLLPVIAPGAAQSGPQQPTTDNTITIPDAERDVLMAVGPRNVAPPQTAPDSSFDHVDILKVVFGEESVSEFRVTMFLKALTSTNTVGSYSRMITFSYGNLNWRLRYGGCTTNNNVGCLQSGDGGFGGFRTTRLVPMEFKADVKALVFVVSKGDIYNQDRAPARFGDLLSNISAYAFHSTFAGGGPGSDFIGGLSAWDYAPNVGFGPPFVFNQGSRNQGDLVLSSRDPIRVSNGEATTIVYQLVVQNRGLRTLNVQLETINVPKDWSVRVPTLVAAQPHTNLTVPVIAGIPFTHEHGKTFTFKVIAKAANDKKSQAEIDLGVFWTDVPQPSAHHQGKQWFHSAPADNQQLPSQLEFLVPQKRYWMNGIEKDPDPEADDANVPAAYQQLPPGGGGGGGGGMPGQFTASWFFPLSPPLLIGLDFDTSRPSLMVFDLIPKVPAPTATVTVRLHYCDPEQQSGGGGGGGGGGNNAANCHQGRPVIALGQQTSSLTASSAVHFEVPLQAQPQYDLVPYKHSANIGLSVTLSANTPQNAYGTEPRPEFVTKKALLELALFEYHDPVQQAFAAVGNLQLAANGETEKLANPGKTSVYTFDLSSDAEEAQSSIGLEIQGVNRDWARILGPAELSMEPKETRNITVAVTVPDDAVDDERADLFLRAENLEDPSIVTAVRFRTTVTTAEQIPDESALATVAATSKTPGPSAAWMLLAALVALGILVRRRSQP